MKIGFTYDLKDDYLASGMSPEDAAEFDELATIEAIESCLVNMGHSVERIGSLHSLLPRLAKGFNWDIVFNIAEGITGMSREAQVPAALEAYGIPHTHSRAAVLAITHNKAFTKRIIMGSGIRTAPFAEFSGGESVDLCDLAFPLFVKPVAEGTGKGVDRHSIVQNIGELRSCVDRLWKAFRQNVLVEEFLPGREFTVGILESEGVAFPIGVMEIIYSESSDYYSLETKKDYLRKVKYSLVKGEIAEKCIDLAMRAHKVLECRDISRVDIRLDDKGEPTFIEINALPGLHPVDSDIIILGQLVGLSHSEIIHKILNSSMSRL